MGTSVTGIALSGYDGDGIEGCKQIKAKGGITFAQNNSAEVHHMPVNAQASGSVDFVISPDKIAGKLKKIGSCC